MLRSREPILVMRHGKVKGLYFPLPTRTLPVEFKREFFTMITQEIGNRLQKPGIKEEELLEGPEKTKKARRRR